MTVRTVLCGNEQVVKVHTAPTTSLIVVKTKLADNLLLSNTGQRSQFPCIYTDKRKASKQ